jgi:hypothetical protein
MTKILAAMEFERRRKEIRKIIIFTVFTAQQNEAKKKNNETIITVDRRNRLLAWMLFFSFVYLRSVEAKSKQTTATGRIINLSKGCATGKFSKITEGQEMETCQTSLLQELRLEYWCLCWIRFGL